MRSVETRYAERTTRCSMQLAIRAETGDGLQVLTGRPYPSGGGAAVPTLPGLEVRRNPADGRRGEAGPEPRPFTPADHVQRVFRVHIGNDCPRAKDAPSARTATSAGQYDAMGARGHYDTGVEVGES